MFIALHLKDTFCNALQGWCALHRCAGALQLLCLCRAAPLTVVGGAHNSPYSPYITTNNYTLHVIDKWDEAKQETVERLYFDNCHMFTFHGDCRSFTFLICFASFAPNFSRAELTRASSQRSCSKFVVAPASSSTYFSSGFYTGKSPNSRVITLLHFTVASGPFRQICRHFYPY